MPDYPLTHPDSFGKWKVKDTWTDYGHGARKFTSYIVTDTTKEDSPDRVLKAAFPKYIDRLKYETKMLEKLDHPNVVNLIDYDLEHDPPYKVAELSSYGGVADAMQNWQMFDWRDANKIIETVADTLGWLHSQGIRHNAIDRFHVLIYEDKTPKIVRFREAEIFGDTHFNTSPDFKGFATLITHILSKTRQLLKERYEGQRKRYLEKVETFEPQPPKALK